VLRLIDEWPGRRPVIDGCEYREAVQAVLVGGGVAANVVPDTASVTINHRFAPDRTVAEAEAFLRELLAGELGEGDRLTVVDAAAGAPPGLTAPLLRRLHEGGGLVVRAKYGWTDVARFTELGVPATNFGPGDPEIAHTAGEWVDGAALVAVYEALRSLITGR
jgi:succinyl-diaminopimelate desuccinylase